MDLNLIIFLAVFLVVVLIAIGVSKMLNAMITIVVIFIVFIMGVRLYEPEHVANTVPEQTEEKDTLPVEDPADITSYTGPNLGGKDSLLVKKETIVVDKDGVIHHYHYYYYPEKEKKDQASDPFIYTEGKLKDQKEAHIPDIEYKNAATNVNCYRYQRSVKRYVIIEHIYTSQPEAEKQAVLFQSQGFKRAQVICLSCFAGYEKANHFAVILDRPCRSEETVNKKRVACLEKWNSKGWPRCEMKLLWLGDLKKIQPAKDLAVNGVSKREIY